MAILDLPPVIRSWQMTRAASAGAADRSSWEMTRKDIPPPGLKEGEVLIAIAGCGVCGTDLGKHCGARGTFWNIRAASPLSYPPADFGPPSMNLVALESARPSETMLDGRWFEVIKPAEIQPKDLHAAQLRRRLENKGGGELK